MPVDEAMEQQLSPHFKEDQNGTQSSESGGSKSDAALNERKQDV